MSEESYITRAWQDPPMAVTLSNAGAHALIDRANLDFRDMREDDGLVVRRQHSDTKGSARFARSLTDKVPRVENISRVAKHSRHRRRRLD